MMDNEWEWIRAEALRNPQWMHVVLQEASLSAQNSTSIFSMKSIIKT